MAPFLRFKLAKILVLIYQNAPVAQQLTSLCSLLQASFATANPFERLVALHTATMLFYSSSQLFAHRRRLHHLSPLVEEYDQAAPVLRDAVASLVGVVREVTTDCKVATDAATESNELARLLLAAALRYPRLVRHALRAARADTGARTDGA